MCRPWILTASRHAVADRMRESTGFPNHSSLGPTHIRLWCAADVAAPRWRVAKGGSFLTRTLWSRFSGRYRVARHEPIKNVAALPSTAKLIAQVLRVDRVLRGFGRLAAREQYDAGFAHRLDHRLNERQPAGGTAREIELGHAFAHN